RRAEAQTDQRRRLRPAPPLHLGDRESDVALPARHAARVALRPRRVAGAVEVETQHREAGARERRGQLLERAMRPHQLVTDRVAENDAGRTPGPGRRMVPTEQLRACRTEMDRLRETGRSGHTRACYSARTPRGRTGISSLRTVNLNSLPSSSCVTS